MPQPCTHKTLFFDNDVGNFRDRDLCPCVIPVQIKESRHIGRTAVFTDTQQFKKFIRNKLQSKMAKHLGKTMGKLSETGVDSYDPVSGLTEEDIARYIIQMIKSKKFRETYQYFIFDWDRTLTVFEGIVVGKSLKEYKKTMYTLTRDKRFLQMRNRDIAEYYFGGLERVTWLKTFWKVLYAYGYQDRVFVLSANPGFKTCKSMFVELLHSIHFNIPAENIHYKGDMQSKYAFIQKNMKHVCHGH